jgi:hypothetical protein
MKPENQKYNEIVNLLRKSKPVLSSPEDIENGVIKRISRLNHQRLKLSEAADFLFGWVYIGWVRRSLITASIALLLFFIYQQGMILKRIDVLSSQTVVSDKDNLMTNSEKLDKLLMVYRNSGVRFSSKTITISESQIKELIESLSDLQIKYRDLENLLVVDPELKSLIEKKMIENNRTKINL